MPMSIDRLDLDERLERPLPSDEDAARWTEESLPLAEEISGGVAQEGAAAALAARPVEPADDDHGNAVEFAHDGLGRRGQLIGDGEDGRLQHMAGGVLLAQVALERLEPGHPDGDIREPLAPGPPEGVRDDDAEIVAGQGAQPIAQAPRGAVRVLGKETGGVCIHVGLIDPRVRADESVMRLHDEHALVLAHHAPALAQDDLYEARITPNLLRQPERLGGGGDVAEADHAPFRLGDDLLAHHEEIACEEGRPLRARGIRDEAGQILPRADLRQALDADNLIARGHPHPPARSARRAGTARSTRRRALRVVAPCSRRRRRSSGASMSSPMPGSRTTTGLSPALRAARR